MKEEKSATRNENSQLRRSPALVDVGCTMTNLGVELGPGEVVPS